MRRGQGKGLTVTAKGYLQITRRGPDRGKLEHRVVMAAMCREFCYYPLNGDGLPMGVEVHHQDFGRRHNCRSNLILLDPSLHLHMDRKHRTERDRMADGRFGPNPVPPVGSVVLHEVFICRDCGMERKVPVSWHEPEELPDWVMEDVV